MKKNLILNIFITFFIGILGFVVNNIFGNYMGKESLGLMRLFTQVIAFLNLAELGVGVAASYSLYKPLEDKDKNKINIIMNTLNNLYRKISIFIFIIGMILNLFIPLFFKENIFGNIIYIYWSLYVVNTALSYWYAKYITLFNANQEYGTVRKIQGFSKIISILFQIIFLVQFQSFVLYILMMTLENLINYYLYKRHYKNKYIFISKTGEENHQIIKDVRNLFWHKIGSVLINNTDFLIISKFISLSVVALYSSYLLVYQMILIVLGVITPVIRPVIGQFIARSTKEEVYCYWKKFYVIYMFSLSIICILSFRMYNPFIKLWMGKEYLLSDLTVILILINLFITVIKRLIEVFKFNSGFFDDIHYPILESIINLIISLYLVDKIGLNGVIIGTLASNIIITDTLKPMLIYKKCFNKSWKLYLKDTFYYKSLVIVSIFISNYLIELIGFMINFDNWKNFVISALIMLLVSTLISVAIFIFDKDFRSIILKVKQKKSIFLILLSEERGSKIKILIKVLYKLASNLPRLRIKVKINKKEVQIILFESIRVFFAKKLLKNAGKNINVGRKVIIGEHTCLGENSGIGCGCKIAPYTVIGRDVMFGPECIIYSANHTTSRLDIPMREQGREKIKPVIIGDDVWIGGRVIILPGVKIGKGSILGAGCVVAKNVPEYSVVVGNPGKVIKNRKK